MAGTFIFIPPVGGAGGSPYFGDPVADPGSLPASGQAGEIRYVISENTIYAWGGASWQAITVVGLDINDTTGDLPLSRTTGTIDIDSRTTGDLPLSRTTGTIDVDTRTSGTLPFSRTSGTVPINRGGTNATSALNNGKMIVSVGGQIVEGTPGVVGGAVDGVESLRLTGAASYIKLAGLTTLQRNDVPVEDGVIIFNTDVQRFQGVFNGMWGSLHGWGN